MNPLQSIDNFFQQFMPPVSRRLFYILVGVFVLQALLGRTFTVLFALIPELVTRGFVWQLLTHGFLHGGLGHLFGNLLGLFFFGAAVEMRLGGRSYLLMLLTAILVGGVLQTGLNLGNERYLALGFSGAVYAILVGCLIYIPNQVVYFNFFIPLKMKWLVIGYLVLDVVGLMSATPTGVGHWAHLMGAAVGFAWIKGPDLLGRGGGRGGGGGGGPRRRKGGKRVKSQPLSMGHPGRSSRASDLYDDPHWRLDQ